MCLPRRRGERLCFNYPLQQQRNSKKGVTVLRDMTRLPPLVEQFDEVRQWSVAYKGIEVEAYTSVKLAVLTLKFVIPKAKCGFSVPPFDVKLPLPLPSVINIMLPGRHAVIQFTRHNEVCVFLRDGSLMSIDRKKELERLDIVLLWLWDTDYDDELVMTVLKTYKKAEQAVYVVNAISAVVSDEAFLVLKCHRHAAYGSAKGRKGSRTWDANGKKPDDLIKK